MPSRLSARRSLLVGASSALIAGALALAAAAPASAEAPVDFGSADIVDTVGALGSDTDSVQAALDDLQQATGTTLLVAFIDTPTSPSDLDDWAAEVVTSNGLGTGNALLVVAVDDREYRFDVDAGLDVSDAQLADIQSEDIVPSLGADEWAQAAIGAARGLAEAQGASLSPDGTTGADGSDGDEQAAGGFDFLPTLLIVGGFLALVILVLVLLARRRSSRARKDRQAAARQQELRAGSLLVELDNAVTTSEQELGFAIAEFGDDQVAPFRAALAAAKNDLRAAFRLRQQLDDATPDSPEQRAAWVQEIIDLATRADAGLDAQTEAFEELRALGRNA
ncbi:MAG: TPM domain-containing protein, partial [Naasia sp.]